MVERMPEGRRAGGPFVPFRGRSGPRRPDVRAADRPRDGQQPWLDGASL